MKQTNKVQLTFYRSNVNSVTKAVAPNLAVVYSMKANVPDGQSLRIVLKGERIWWIEILPNAPVNWIVGEYDENTQSQIFTLMEGERISDLSIRFFDLDERESPQAYITIEYFENDAVTPTKLELGSE